MSALFHSFTDFFISESHGKQRFSIYLSGEMSNKDKLRELLGREMRVEVSDGRIITGAFYCIDNNKNIILRDCIQEQVIPIPNVPGSYTVPLFPGNSYNSYGNEQKLNGPKTIMQLAWC